ncbi:MAG: glycosyltransferase [bacterium]
MKIAIVHDYLNQYGGAERVVKYFHELYPEAPIYTSFYIPDSTYPEFKECVIKTSFMQHLPFIRYLFRFYFYLFPLAFRSFNFKGYDLLLTSSSTFAKGINKAGACHICYCHSPMRVAWNNYNYIGKGLFKNILRLFLSPFLAWLRSWDYRAAQKVDYFVCNSKNIAGQLSLIYHRSAEVIYPPTDISQFYISDSVGDYYLIVSRLYSYKNIKLAIDVFNKNGLNLAIIGKGPDEAYFKKISGKNIRYLGIIDDKALAGYYSKCKALIFPGEEDFGITPVEAMASGRPVIAYGKGGALESVVDNVTGIFFKDPNEGSLQEAISKCENTRFDSKKIRDHAMQFDVDIFKSKIDKYIKEKYREYEEKI